MVAARLIQLREQQTGQNEQQAGRNGHSVHVEQASYIRPHTQMHHGRTLHVLQDLFERKCGHQAEGSSLQVFVSTLV